MGHRDWASGSEAWGAEESWICQALVCNFGVGHQDQGRDRINMKVICGVMETWGNAPVVGPRVHVKIWVLGLGPRSIQGELHGEFTLAI